MPDNQLVSRPQQHQQKNYDKQQYYQEQQQAQQITHNAQRGCGLRCQGQDSTDGSNTTTTTMNANENDNNDDLRRFYQPQQNMPTQQLT